MEWKDEMGQTNRRVAAKHLDEKRIRDAQIAVRDERRTAEKEQRLARERRDLADCRNSIESAKQRQLANKLEASVRLVAISVP